MPSSPALFEVDAFGCFSRERVDVRFRDIPRATSPEIERMIAETWERVTAECAARGAILYNGSLVRWIDHRIEDGVLRIDAGPTDYRACVGTNFYNSRRVGEFGRERFSNPIGITGSVITSDGWLVYGRRSHRVVYHAGYLHTFGGTLETLDAKADGTVDVFGSLARELHEELHVEPADVESVVCLGLIHDFEITQPELLFDVRVKLRRDEVTGRLDHADAHQEHTAIECVRDEPESIVPFIRASSPIAPVCVGAICLHGRLCWGEAWYAAALRSL